MKKCLPAVNGCCLTLLLFCALLCGLLLPGARAAFYQWGPGLAGAWVTPANWTPLGPPNPADTADFSGAGYNNVDMGGFGYTPFSIANILIGGGPGDWYDIGDSSNDPITPVWNTVTVTASITKNGLSDTYLYNSSIITPLLTVNQGFMRIAETNNFRATTVDVNGGILCVGALPTTLATVSAANWNVYAGGTLRIRGNLVGAVNNFGGAVINPGCSVGTANIQGNMVYYPGSSSTFELDTPNIVGVVNDLFNVKGNLTLNGVIDVVALPNFGPGVYRLFNYTGSLTGPLPTLGAVPPNFDYYLDTATPGQVNLRVSPKLVDCACLAKLHELQSTGCQDVIPNLCGVAYQCWLGTNTLNCSQMPPFGTLITPGTYPVTLLFSDPSQNLTQACQVNFVLTAPSSGCSTNGCVPPPSGMVAWWPLDEVNGAAIYADFSGNGNAAIVESGGPVGSPGSPFAIPGKVAGANYFYGQNIRGRAPNTASLNFGTGNFAADCWVKPVQVTPATWQPIVDKLNAPTPANTFGYAVGITNGRVGLLVGNGALQTLQSVNLINYNAWNFIAVSVDRNAATVTFYVNGVAETPQFLSLPGSINNSVDALVGGTYAIISPYGELGLDEVELFNRTLAVAEMDALRNADSAGKCKTNQSCLVCPPTSLSITGCPPRVPDFSTNSFAGSNCTPVGPLTVTQNIPPGTQMPPGTTVVIINVCDALGNCRSCDVTLQAVFGPGCTPCPCSTNNLIVNGSFENPPFGIGGDCQQLPVGPSIMPGWTVTIDEIARCQFAAPYNVMPSDGLLFADLTGYSDAPPHGALTQTVPTTTGQCYRLTFDLGVNLDWPGLLDGPITVKVMAGAATGFFTHNPTGSGTVWSNYAFSFTATGPSTAITIAGVSGKNFIGLDNVALVCSCACTNTCVPSCPPATLSVTGCPPIVPDFATNGLVVNNCTPGSPLTITQTPLAGTILAPGLTPVIVTACDAAGHCATCTTVITAVYAGAPPIIICPSNIVADTYLWCGGSNGTTVGYSAPQVLNGVLVSCFPPSGSLFPLGYTTVTCVATNSCGTSQCSFSILVQYGPTLIPPCAPPPANMVMWLKFDETSGVTALNASAGNHGTLINGPTRSLGQYVVNSLCFNGVNQYVEVQPYAAMQFGTGDFSIDAWVKPATLDNTVRVIVEHREASALVTRGYSLFLQANNILGFEIADGTSISYASGLTVPANGQWHYVAVTVKRGDPQGIRFYVDGIQSVPGRDPTGHPGSITAGPCTPFRVGSRSSSVSNLFNGCIDEVELFRRSLSAAELQSIYDARCKGKCRIACNSPGLGIIPGCWVGHPAITNQIVIINNLPTPQTFNWSLIPLPASGACNRPGPTFSPSSGTVNIPGNNPAALNVAIFLPVPFWFGDCTCYRLVISLPDGSQQVQCDGSICLQGLGGVCALPSTQLGLATNLESTTVSFSLEGTTNISTTLSNGVIVLRSPDNDVISATPVPTLTIPPAGGGSQEVHHTFAFPEYDPGRLYSLRLETSPDSDGHSGVLASIPVLNMIPNTDSGPTLSIGAGTGGTIIITWPDPCGRYRLERTAQVLGSDTVWTTVTNAPGIDSKGKNLVILPAQQPASLYRLKLPLP